MGIDFPVVPTGYFKVPEATGIAIPAATILSVNIQVLCHREEAATGI